MYFKASRGSGSTWRCLLFPCGALGTPRRVMDSHLNPQQYHWISVHLILEKKGVDIIALDCTKIENYHSWLINSFINKLRWPYFPQIFIPFIPAAENVFQKRSTWCSCFSLFAVISCRVPQEHQRHNNAQESCANHVIHGSCDLNRKREKLYFYFPSAF